MKDNNRTVLVYIEKVYRNKVELIINLIIS